MSNDVTYPLGLMDDGRLVTNPYPNASRLVIGPSGSSKTTSVVMPTVQALLPYDDITVVTNDPKDGEVFAQFANVATKYGRKCGLIDDFGLFGFDHPCHLQLNPFGSVLSTADHKPEELFFALETATHGIVPEVNDGGRNFHFRDEPRKILHFYMNGIMEQLSEPLTPGTLYSVMADPYTSQSLCEDAADSSSPQLKARAESLLEYKKRQPEGYYRHLRTALSPLECYERGSILHVAGQNADITHEQLCSEGWMIFFVLPQRHAKRVGLHYTLHQQSFMDAQLSGRGGKLVNIIDEMCNSSQKDEVERVTIQRSYQKRNDYIAQTLSDIEEKYGKHQLATLIDNCPVVQYLAFSSEAEAEKVSRAMGEEIAIMESIGLNPERLEVTGNLSTGKQRVFTATELMTLDPAYQIIHIKGYGWIYCKKLKQNNLAPTCFDLSPNPKEQNQRLPPDPLVTLPARPEDLS